MPAKSQQQLKMIYARRNRYKSEDKTPKKWKWIWDEDWTDVSFKELPEKIEEYKFNRQVYIELLSEESEFTKEELKRMSDREIKDLYDALYLETTIDDEEGTEDFNDDLYTENLITKFDRFINETKK
jgi:hypothetical protein